MKEPKQDSHRFHAVSDTWNLVKLCDAINWEQQYLCITHAYLQSFKERVLNHGWSFKDRRAPLAPWAVNSLTPSGPVFLVVMCVEGRI